MDDRDMHSSEQRGATGDPEGQDPDIIHEEPFDPEEVDAAGSDPEPSAAEPSEPASPEADDAAAAPQSPASEPSEPSIEQRLEAARQSAARNREQMLRVAADFDNFRKRSVRDLDDARRRARQGVIRDMLPVFDNLERAAAHVDDNSDPAAVAQGIRLVLKQFIDTLTRMDVARIDEQGATFDPAVHESIQMVDSEQYEAGTVVSVVQPGYRHGGELIRPALVAVSKGPPAAPPPATAEPVDEGDGSEAADGEPTREDEGGAAASEQAGEAVDAAVDSAGASGAAASAPTDSDETAGPAEDGGDDSEEQPSSGA